MSTINKRKKVTLVGSPVKNNNADQPIKKHSYKIDHPLYDRFLSNYTVDYIVTDSIKESLAERVKTMELTQIDIENIFLLVMTHWYRNPVKDTFNFNTSEYPYGGKQLKTKKEFDFQIDSMPDQIIYILHSFLDLLDDDNRSQIDETELPPQFDDANNEGEYNQTNLGYAVIN